MAAAGRCYKPNGRPSSTLSFRWRPAVALVLVLGLANMLRGGSPNTSQLLMRWRVVLQFIAIVIIMTTIWLMQK